MMLLLAALFSFSALAGEKITVSGQLQTVIFDQLYYVYCEKGTRAIDRDKALESAREIANGEYSREDFLTFWGPTCSYEQSKYLARDARLGKIDAPFFALIVGKKCRHGHALKPQEAELAAREMASKSIEAKVYIEEWESSCRNTDSMRRARHEFIRAKRSKNLKTVAPGSPDPEGDPIPKVY